MKVLGFDSKQFKFHAIALIVCLALSVVAYGNIIDSFFLSDDFNWVYQVKTRGPLGVWTTPPDVFFRPLISLTLFFDYQIWGLNPVGYHLTNIFFHGLNAFLVYQLSRLLFRGAKLAGNFVNLAAIVSAFIFIILPSHVEAVTWISARSDLIATCFVLAAFCCYLTYKDTGDRRLFIVSYFLFFLGLISKELAVIYPGLVFLYEIYDRINRQEKIKNGYQTLYFPLIYLSAVPPYLGLRYWGLRQLLGGYGSGIHMNFDPAIIMRGLGSSLRIFIPPLPHTTEQDWVIFFVAFLVAILIFIIACFGKGGLYNAIAKLVILLLGFFLVALFPVINIRISVWNTEGERLLYLPSVFMVILGVLVLGFMFSKIRRMTAIVLIIVSIFFSYNLYTSNHNWSLAGQVSKQVVESLDDQIEGDGMFLINIPDNLNGAYLYRNGLYPAILLFCPSKSDILFLDNATFNNLRSPADAVKIERISDREYRVKLLSPGTYFMNVNAPFEQRLETQNFVISDVDYTTMQSFRIKIKDWIDPDLVAYYSNGKVISLKKEPPFQGSFDDI